MRLLRSTLNDTEPLEAQCERAVDPKRFVLVEGGSHHNAGTVSLADCRDAVRELFGVMPSPDGVRVLQAGQ